MAKLQCDICGGKLMAKSGGIYECEFCGVQYDTEWAKAKIQEIRGTVQVEGTVEVKGTVTVDTQSEKTNLLKRMAICAEDRDFKNIKKLTEQLLILDPECGEAYLWQIAQKYFCTTLDDIFKQLLPTLESIAKSTEWKNAIRYADTKRSEELKAHMDSAIDYWKKDDPELKRRFDKIQPVQNLIYSFNGGIIALQSDGTVRATYTEKGKWLSAVEQWTGIKKICTDDIYNYVIGLRWDGTLVAVTGSAKTDEIIKELLSWVNNGTKIVDVCSDGKFIVYLLENGELLATIDEEFDPKEPCYYGFAEEWNDVVSLNIVRVSNSHLCGVFRGEQIYGLEAYMVLGITKDGRIRCTASDLDLGEPHIEREFRLPFWENIKNVKKIDSIMVLQRDGTLSSSHGFRDADNKWLDFSLTDKGCFMIREAPDERFFERSLVADGFYCALRSDGTVLWSNDYSNNAARKEVEQWTNIVALNDIYFNQDSKCVLGVREDGKVLVSWIGKPISEISVDGWKLFDSFETFEQERKVTQKRIEEDAEKKRIAEAKEKAEAERKAEQKRKAELEAKAEAERLLELERKAKEQERQDKRNRGVCQHCGGEFKGLFIKKCTKCGFPKDY